MIFKFDVVLKHILDLILKLYCESSSIKVLSKNH